MESNRGLPVREDTRQRGRYLAQLGTRIGLVGLVLVVATLSTLSPAGAHSGVQSYLYLDVTSTTVGGRLEAPIRDLNEVFDLGLEGEDEEMLSILAENQGTLTAYLDEHIDVGANGQQWPLVFGDAELFFSDAAEDDDNYVVFPFTAEVSVNPVPRELEVRFDPFVDEISGRDGLLLIGNDWQNGVIDNGSDWLTGFDAETRTQTIDLGDPSWFRNLTSSVKLGVDHIRTGPDHILFVLVLLLPSVLVFTRRWEPAPSFGSSLWRVLKIVTMFTVAHSITFSLAGLEILPLPSPRIVESIIALSIAAAALHNIRPLAANKEWIISFAFGLFHGMGFASLVSGLDVDRSTQLVSLLGRNIGIEIGQAIVVIVLFPALFFLRRTRYYLPFLTAASIALAIAALGWVIERSLEVELGVSNVIDPIFSFPAVIIWVVAATVISYMLMTREAATGDLLPVAGSGEDAAPEADESLVGAG